MGWFKVRTHVLLLCWTLTTTGQEFRPLPDSLLRAQSFGLENFLMQSFSTDSREEIPRRSHESLKTSSSSSFRDPYTVEFQIQNHNHDVPKAIPPSHRPIPFTHQDVPSAHMKPVHEDPEGDLPLVPPPPRRRIAPEGTVYKRISSDTRRPLERPAEFQVTITEDDPPSTVVVAPPQPGQPERHRKRVMKRRRKKPVATPPETVEDIHLTKNYDPENEVKEIRVNLFPENQEDVRQPSREERPHRRRPSEEQNREDRPQVFRRKPSETVVEEVPQSIREEKPPKRKQQEAEVDEGLQSIREERPHNHRRRPAEEDLGVPSFVRDEAQAHRKHPEVEEEIKEERPQNHRKRPSELHNEADLYKAIIREELPSPPPPPQPTQRKKPVSEAPPEEEVSFLSPFEKEEVSEEPPKPPRRKSSGHKRIRDPIAESLAHLAAQPDVVRPEEEEDSNIEAIEKFKKDVSSIQEGEIFKTDYVSFTTETPQEPTHRLKTLLKQQNGQLSLSELLQTQNLSLADFLKGNPGALSALGANKINGDKPTTPQPEAEKPKYQSRPQIPKISKNSRPFSKSKHEDQQKSTERTTTESHHKELPKKLDIVEVTSDRPSYNGFVPKHPKSRLGSRYENKATISSQKIDDQASESIKSIILAEEEKNIPEITSQATISSTRSPVYRLTTPVKESTISEQRVVPKRFNEFRPKSRIDRRKSSTEGNDGATVTEEPETTLKVTTETRPTQIPKNRVRIPFMSTNNPEISVIVSNRKVNVTEKPKERLALNMRDRINLFKRINVDQKPKEEPAETKQPETTEPIQTTQPITTTTEEAPFLMSEEPIIKITTTEVRPTTVSLEEAFHETFNESSDEIVELLKTGSNAQRLQRILEARNMTVGELLEKRASSSKQPNVTHLFQNQTSPQLSSHGKVVQLSDNQHPVTDEVVKVTTTNRPTPPPHKTKKLKEEIDSLKDLDRPHLETNSFDELFVDESIIQPIKINFDDKEKRDPKAYETTEKSHKNVHRIHLNLSPGTEGKAKHPVPLWNVDEKSIYNTSPYGYPTYDLNKNLAGKNIIKEHLGHEEVSEKETLIVETVRRNEGSNSNLQSHINEILKEQVEVVKDVRPEDKTFIPPAVKSAIIASGVVMGIALIVFVAIFAACGWKQRQFRLRARSSILNDSLNGSGHKVIKRTGTLSPISFKRSALYKKTLEFEDSDSSISGSSNTSSYLWNTLKHTFQSRNSTLKNHQEKEEKLQERKNRSRRNTLTRDEDRPRNSLPPDEIMVDLPRRNTLTRDDFRRESLAREGHRRESTTLHRDDLRRESTMSRDAFSKDDHRRDSTISRDFPREETRRSSMFRDDTRRLNSLLRENERCSFKKIDPDRNIIQTSVNFKRGGFNGSSSRHFDSCDHFN